MIEGGTLYIYPYSTVHASVRHHSLEKDSKNLKFNPRRKCTFEYAVCMLRSVVPLEYLYYEFLYCYNTQNLVL